MSTLNYHSQFVPLVFISIEHFCPELSLLDILPGARYYHKGFSKWTARMAMSRISHLFFGFIHISSLWAWILYNLVHLEHSVRKSIEVTTSNNKYFGFNCAYLNCLEIMGEVWLSVDIVCRHLLIQSIIDVKLPGIFLHYVYIKTFHIHNAQTFCLLLISHNRFLSGGWGHWFKATSITHAFAHVLNHVSIRSLRRAFRTLEYKLIKHFFNHSVHV